MNNETEIRQANSRDSLNLAALSIQVWLHAYATDGLRTDLANYVLTRFTPQYFDQLNKDSNHCLLVAVKDDFLLGYVNAKLDSYWQSEANGYEVETLYVQEHCQGRGIGRALLEAMTRQLGHSYWLSTWIHNEPAIHFYRHLGLRQIGLTHFEIDGQYHENVVLAATADTKV